MALQSATPSLTPLLLSEPRELCAFQGEMADVVANHRLKMRMSLATKSAFLTPAVLGETLFAVPWVSLELDPALDRFVLDVDREKLKDAPGFDRDDWPNMSDTYWGTDVPKFYNVRPD